MTKSLVGLLEDLKPNQQKEALKELEPNEYADLFFDWEQWARPDQLPPSWDWTTWLILAGRGWGKTRCGAEWVCQRVREGYTRIALVGETAADVRDVMFEGESGILSISPPWDMPMYIPSKRRLTWPNGAMAFTYSGLDPDQLRGPQHDTAWADEPAKWRYADVAWTNLMLGLRLGKDPRICGTTTPRPIPLIKTLLEDEQAHVTRGSTMDNLVNLAPSFRRAILSQYEGTRLGRQEIYAEVLDDVPGALWQRSLIDDARCESHPDLERIVVGIDPAASSEEGANETGMVVAGIAEDKGYVLDDLTGVFTPSEWASIALKAYYKYDADRIVAEVNQGGEMVEHTIRTLDKNASYTAVRASRGKIIRAEPIAALYEQGRIHHVGQFSEMEDQMCEYTAESSRSPDRLDALVWALTDLMLGSRDGGVTQLKGL